MIAVSKHIYELTNIPGRCAKAIISSQLQKLRGRFMAAVATARRPVSIPNLDNLPPSALLTRDQVAALSGFALVTLKKWSSENRGPKITRVEGRPRYRAADVTAWLNAQT